MFVTPGTCDSTRVTAFTQFKQVMPVIASVVAPSMVSYDPDRPAFFSSKVGPSNAGKRGDCQRCKVKAGGEDGLEPDVARA